MDELNLRIIDLMNKLGHSKSTFAKELGISLPIITHISTGRNKPGLDIIQKIISTFEKVNPYWLLLGEGAMLKEPEKPQIDIQAIKSQLAQFQTKLTEPKKAVKTVLEYHKILIDEVLHLKELTKMIETSQQDLAQLEANIAQAGIDLDNIK